MSENFTSVDAGAIWRGQEREEEEIQLEDFIQRRTLELAASTRSETVTSIGAVIFLVAVTIWRFAANPVGLQRLMIEIAFIWVLISILWFRAQLWNQSNPPKDAIADSCSSFYRKQLERRRDHLRNVWLWNGPLILACLVLGTTILGISYRRLVSISPLIFLLFLWIGFSLRNRYRQAKWFQQEIDELSRTVHENIRLDS